MQTDPVTYIHAHVCTLTVSTLSKQVELHSNFQEITMQFLPVYHAVLPVYHAVLPVLKVYSQSKCTHVHVYTL